MRWLIELVVGFFKVIFSISMEHPYEEKEEMYDVGNTTFDNPDDVFCNTDW